MHRACLISAYRARQRVLRNTPECPQRQLRTMNPAGASNSASKSLNFPSAPRSVLRRTLVLHRRVQRVWTYFVYFVRLMRALLFKAYWSNSVRSELLSYKCTTQGSPALLRCCRRRGHATCRLLRALLHFFNCANATCSSLLCTRTKYGVVQRTRASTN